MPVIPLLQGLRDWPAMLGYNRAALHPDGHLVASIGGDPLIAVRTVKAGADGRLLLRLQRPLGTARLYLVGGLSYAVVEFSALVG